MIKLKMWAIICLTAPYVYSQNPAQNSSIDCDTTEYAIERILEEVGVTVKLSSVTETANGKIIRPKKETIRASADGIDLLRKLQLPRVNVNPMTNSVDITGGGKVILCINGVESTPAMVSAIRPQDIKRINYYENPGVRYYGAEVVIDYITSRWESGGSIFLNSFDALAKGKWASIDNFSAQYNSGTSVWSADISYFGKRSDNWSRNYEETWKYPDAKVTRYEHGLPVKIGNHSIESVINYNNLLLSGNLLNVRFGLNVEDVPNKEEGDRRGFLQVSDTEEPLLVTEHTEELQLQPEISVYYKYNISDDRDLIFDVGNSYIHSRVKHNYAENGVGESSRVIGDKYGWNISATFEHRNENRTWKAAVYSSCSFLHNKYLTEEDCKVIINQSETALMGEYSNRFGKLSLNGNIKAVYRYIGQTVNKISAVCVLPELNISFRVSDKIFMRYSAAMDTKMPSPAEISDIVQPIQSGLIRRGNPNLKSFRVINQSADLSYSSTYLSISARFEYQNEHKPIMESVLFENGEFVRTYFNQRSFQRIMAVGALTLKPWQNHLSVTVQPTYTRYFSHGINYYHTHNIFRLGLSADFSFGNFIAYGNLMSGPANKMYGEEIIEEKDMNQIMVGYKRDKWSIQAGVFNAFINYWMCSRNLSSLIPYSSKAYNVKNSSYFSLKFNLSFDFGRKIHEVKLDRNNIPDRDSGILNGIK